MLTTLRLPGSAVVPASGTQRVTLGPVPPFQTWRVAQMSVSATVGTATATVTVGGVTIDSTYSGEKDASPLALDLQAGESIVCEWTGATVGATVTFTIIGTIDVTA